MTPPKTRKSSLTQAVLWADKNAPLQCIATALRAFEDGYLSGFVDFIDFAKSRDPEIQLDRLIEQFREEMQRQ